MKLLQKIFCFFSNHTLRKIKDLNISGSLYQCVHCDKKLAINHHIQTAVDWDDEMEKEEIEMTKIFARFK